jgi:hypothetical protein
MCMNDYRQKRENQETPTCTSTSTVGKPGVYRYKHTLHDYCILFYLHIQDTNYMVNGTQILQKNRTLDRSFLSFVLFDYSTTSVND